MGQEVKNPLRAQSKYGLMGSSAKTEKKFFRGSPEHFLDKNAIWDGTPPHLHINCSLHVWGRAQGSKIVKRNSIISIRSKVMAFLVILLSPCGPHRPRRPHVVPVSSLCRPHCPHVIPTSLPHRPQKVPMWSPWSVVSTCCPCRPHHPCVVPIIPTSSRRSSHHAQPPRYPLYPPPPPWGVGAPNQ